MTNTLTSKVRGEAVKSKRYRFRFEVSRHSNGKTVNFYCPNLLVKSFSHSSSATNTRSVWRRFEFPAGHPGDCVGLTTGIPHQYIQVHLYDASLVGCYCHQVINSCRVNEGRSYGGGIDVRVIRLTRYGTFCFLEQHNERLPGPSLSRTCHGSGSTQLV